jgi:hypothetical protein
VAEVAEPVPLAELVPEIVLVTSVAELVLVLVSLFFEAVPLEL